MQVGFERGMGGDEFVDVDRFVGEAELFEQGWEVVCWAFH
jgi:hypothetical protein